MNLRVLLVGQEAAGAKMLQTLAASDHQVVGVLTEEPVSKGGPASLAGIAEGLEIETLPAEYVRDPGFAARIHDWSVDILLNAHSLHIITDEVLSAPKIGSFNLHPGPLPEYSGLNTVGWAIYNDESRYGVTVHRMAAQIDAGPIAFEERFTIEEGATALTLSAECTRRGVELLVRVLECAEHDPRSIPAEPQDMSRRKYYHRDSIPQEGRVDWTLPATDVARFGRAFDYGPFVSPWGLPTMDLGLRQVEVVGLTPTGHKCSAPPGTPRLTRDGLLEVACPDEWVRVRRLYAKGSPIEASALLNALAEEESSGCEEPG